MADSANNRDTPPHRRPKSGPPGWRVEGGPPQKGEGKTRRRRIPGGPTFWWILVGALALNWFIVQGLVPGEPDRITIPYTSFLTQLDGANVVRITSRGDQIQGEFHNPVKELDGDKQAKLFRTVRPSYVENDNLLQRLESKNVPDTARSLDEARPLWETILVGFGPAILLILLFVVFFRRAAGGGGGGGVLGFGRSRAKRYEASEQRTTFADVAGIDEVKLELSEVVDFLKHPDRYLRLGGKIPRGVLLYGDRKSVV